MKFLYLLIIPILSIFTTYKDNIEEDKQQFNVGAIIELSVEWNSQTHIWRTYTNIDSINTVRVSECCARVNTGEIYVTAKNFEIEFTFDARHWPMNYMAKHINGMEYISTVALCCSGELANQFYSQYINKSLITGSFWRDIRQGTFNFTLTVTNEPPKTEENIRKDLHFPINVGQEFDLIDTLNNSIEIDFVNRDGLSFKYLLDNGYATITPLNTPDLNIPFALGTFKFNVLITCPFGNTADVNVSVHTFDREAPVIPGNLVVNTTNERLLTFEEIFENIIITDNFDVLDISNIEILEDTYTSNFNIGGVWTKLFRAMDFSGNYTIGTMRIYVEDRLAPTLTGIERNIERNIDTPMSIQDVINNLTANDETDGDITNRIRVYHDNFTGNEREAGTFKLTLYVTDLSGNRTYLPLEITNTSDVPPTIIIIDSSVLVVPRGTLVDRQDLINLLDMINLINIEYGQNIEIQTEFFDTENNFGIFSATIIVTDENGNLVQELNIELRVDGFEETNPYDVSLFNQIMFMIFIFILYAVLTLLLLWLGIPQIIALKVFTLGILSILYMLFVILFLN